MEKYDIANCLNSYFNADDLDKVVSDFDNEFKDSEGVLKSDYYFKNSKKTKYKTLAAETINYLFKLDNSNMIAKVIYYCLNETPVLKNKNMKTDLYFNCLYTHSLNIKEGTGFPLYKVKLKCNELAKEQFGIVIFKDINFNDLDVDYLSPL